MISGGAFTALDQINCHQQQILNEKSCGNEVVTRLLESALSTEEGLETK